MEFTPLVSGDELGLVCTGSVCTSKREVVESSAYFLEHYGLTARFDYHTYTPVPARVRAETLLQYLQNDQIKLIWSLRGGEGSADLLPFLEAQAHLIKACTPKIFLGFSDFTAILIYFSQRFGWPVMHGLGARQLAQHTVDVHSVKQTLGFLFAENGKINVSELNPLNFAAKVSMTISGFVTGGNLSLIQISLKDIWEVRSANKILLIEEVNESPYRISRTLKHLYRIGFFSQVKAIIFAGCDFPKSEKKLEKEMLAMLVDFAKLLPSPVLYCDKIGHGKVNVPIPYFKEARLTLGESATLNF